MYKTKQEKRVCQGDVFADVKYSFLKKKDKELKVETIAFPYMVVLSQECDLERDFKNRNDLTADNNDKFLQSVLVCPAYLADELRSGIHLQGMGLKMERWNSDRWGIIKNNDNERFHYLAANEEFGITEIVIDFKHFYTIIRDELYAVLEENYKASMDVLFRERLSQRFANYLSRIGLPEAKA